MSYFICNLKKVRKSLLATSLLCLPVLTLCAQTTAFTYQGSLSQSGQSANGNYDLRFSLYDSATNGSQVGGSITNSLVGVTNGLFTVGLDFGAGIFDGGARWLQIEVRTNGNDAFTSLSPRQPITSAPYAVQAASASSVAATNISGTFTQQVVLSGSSPTLSLYGPGSAGAHATIDLGTYDPGTNAPSARIQTSDNNYGSDWDFYSKTPGAMTNPLVSLLHISALGSVGIGTNNPSARLHVTSTSFPTFLVDGASSVGTWMALRNSGGGTNWLFIATGTNNGEGAGKLLFSYGSAPNNVNGNAMTLTTSGVGIGTTSPTNALQVNGNIQMGPGGANYASSSQENLRIIRGTVNANGSIFAGSGFTLQHVATGHWRVLFNTPYSGNPTATVSCLKAIGNVNAYSTSSFDVVMSNTAGTLVDDGFSFIAMGPQ